MNNNLATLSNARTTDQKLFGRECNVIIYNMRTSQKLELSGLRMKFQIQKSSSSDPNQSTLEIYNLAEESRAFANIPPLLSEKAAGNKPVLQKDLADATKGTKQNIPKDGLFIELFAGYSGLTRMICSGHASGGSVYQKPDWITKLIISDGFLHLRHATFEKSYAAGYSVQKVILDLVNSFGLPLGYIKPFITSDVLEFGLALSGQNKKLLDSYAATYGFRWSVQNNAINLYDEKQALPETVLLTPRSGLLSAPIRTDKGLEFDALLIPLIAPGVTVRIEGSSTFSGECLIQRVQMNGDTHGAEWKMHCEANLK